MSPHPILALTSNDNVPQLLVQHQQIKVGHRKTIDRICPHSIPKSNIVENPLLNPRTYALSRDTGAGEIHDYLVYFTPRCALADAKIVVR